MISRADYMNGKATHAEYYRQFLSPGLIAAVVSRIGAERIRASTDPHMNDIQLRQWDDLQGLVTYYCAKSIRSVSTGGVSLSDCVCVAKQAATVWKEAR